MGDFMAQRVQEIQVTSTRVADMLDGGQYQGAERSLSKLVIQRDPVLAVLQAEVEIYYTRFDAAAELLDRVKSGLGDLQLASVARYTLARGELHYWRYEYEAAEQEFLAAKQICRLLGEPFLLARCYWEIGRLQRRQAEYTKAEACLQQARELVKDESTVNIERFEFLSGLIDYNEGTCCQQLGDLDRASELYGSAIELLRRSEEGRYYGNALNSYGSLLIRLGRYQEALEPLQSASRIFTELATLEDLSHSRSNLGWALLKLGNYVEAEQLMCEGLELAQRIGDIAGAAIRLNLLTELHLEKGEFDAARRYNESAIQQADLGNHGFERSYTRITAGRIALARGDALGAERHLTVALEIGEKMQSGALIARASLYLAEAFLGISTVKGQEFLARATQSVAEYRDAALEADLTRVASRYRGERIVVTPDNKLTINGHLLPTWNAAKESVERFLLKNALAQSGDNQAKAGEILSISKVHVHDKRKQYGL